VSPQAGVPVVGTPVRESKRRGGSRPQVGTTWVGGHNIYPKCYVDGFDDIEKSSTAEIPLDYTCRSTYEFPVLLRTLLQALTARVALPKGVGLYDPPTLGTISDKDLR